MEKTDRNQTIGKRVKKFREARGWSQNQLAKELTSRPNIDTFYAMTVKRIEDGEREAKLGELIDLAAVLGVTIDSLVNENDDSVRENERLLNLSKALDQYEKAQAELIAGSSKMYAAISDMQGYFSELEQEKETPRFKNATVLKAYEAAYIEQAWKPLFEGVRLGYELRTGNTGADDWEVNSQAVNVLGVEQDNSRSGYHEFLFQDLYFEFTRDF